MDKEIIRQLPREERIDVLRRGYFATILKPWTRQFENPDGPVIIRGNQFYPNGILSSVVEGDALGRNLTKHTFDMAKATGLTVAGLVNSGIEDRKTK